MKIVIADGKAKFVYDDQLHAVLGRLGAVQIRRASTVEFDHARQGWMVDLEPTVPGLVLGPFVSRTLALEEERVYVEAALGRTT